MEQIKDSWTLELDISKEEFMRRLEAVTVPMELDSINGSWGLSGIKNFLVNAIQQDYNVMNNQYNSEIDIVHGLDDVNGRIFLAEIDKNSARLYLPNYFVEGKYTRGMIDSLESESRSAIKELSERFLMLIRYIFQNTMFLPIDFSRSYALNLSIEKVSVNKIILKLKMFPLKNLKNTAFFKGSKNYLKYLSYRYYLPGKYTPKFFGSKIIMLFAFLSALSICSYNLFPDYVSEGSLLHQQLVFGSFLMFIIVSLMVFIFNTNKVKKKINEYLKLEMQTYTDCLKYLVK